ncbi:MAG: DUF2085 domain-containing protein [Spirochaetales bacterium]|nr:DUF2085 domain-containing protein [Spirochaetales bacterium]
MIQKFLTGLKLSIYSILILFNVAGLFLLFFPEVVPIRYFGVIFKTVCHQGDVLVFMHHTFRLPLCYRCSGLYFFLLIGAFSAKRLQKIMKGRRVYLVLFAGVLPMILDGFLKFSAQSNLKLISFLTGSIFGFTCGAIIMYGINNLITIQQQSTGYT